MENVLVEQNGFDTEEKSPGLLPVVLRRHSCLENISDFVSSALHVESLSCVLISRDGYLSVRWLDGRRDSVSCLGRVQRCIWTSHKSPPTFVALTVDLRLVWVAVFAESSQDKHATSTPPSCSRICYITPTSIRRRMGAAGKDLQFKQATLLGLLSNDDVVLLVDHQALLVLSVSIPDPAATPAASATPTKSAPSTLPSQAAPPTSINGGGGGGAELEANINIVSCCMLRAPGAHAFADPPVVIPTESRPVAVRLQGNIAVAAWTGGSYYTFSNLETGDIVLVINTALTCSAGASPLFTTETGSVEFSVTPDLSHIAVACSYSTPPSRRCCSHLRQGSAASRGSVDDGHRYANRGSPYLQESDVRNGHPGSNRGGSGLHFLDVIKYIRQHPGHTSHKLIQEALHSRGREVQRMFPYLNNSNWDEEADDIAFMAAPYSGLVGDALWHRELSALRRGIDAADSTHIGMPTGAGTLPCAFRNESESDAVIVHLRCLASIHASPQETAGSSNGTSSKDTASTTTTLLSATRGTEQDTLLPEKSTLQHARNHSGIVLATMTAIEALVEQSRLNSTQAASLQLWQPAKKCTWGSGFLSLPTDLQSHLVVTDVVLSASTAAVLLLPKPGGGVAAARDDLTMPSSLSLLSSSQTDSASSSLSDLQDGALVVYSCHDGNTAVYPFSQGCLPVNVRYGHLPYCVLSARQLFTVVYGVQQEDIVNRLILYENAILAELVCRLNHWERCSLPLTALDSALRHKQLDSVAFFLNSQQGGSLGTDSSDTVDGSGGKPRRGAPKLAPAQVEIAIDLLTQSVERSAAKQNNQYCQQLLHLALSFLDQLMDAALARLAELEDEEDDDDDEDDDDAITREGEDDTEEDAATPVGSLSTVTSPYRSLLSAESRTSRLRVLSECSTSGEDIIDSLSVEKLGKAVARLRKFVRPAATQEPLNGEASPAAPSSQKGSSVDVSLTATPQQQQPQQQQYATQLLHCRPARAGGMQWPEHWAELEVEEVIRDGILTSRIAATQAFLVHQGRQQHIADLDLASTCVTVHSRSASPREPTPNFGTTSTFASQHTHHHHQQQQQQQASASSGMSTSSGSGQQSASSSRSSSVVPFGRLSARNSPMIRRQQSGTSVVVVGSGTGSRQASPALFAGVRDAIDLESQLQDAMLEGSSPVMARSSQHQQQQQPQMLQQSHSGRSSVLSGVSLEQQVEQHAERPSLNRVLSQEYCRPEVNSEPWREIGAYKRILAVGADMVLHSLLDRNFSLAVKILQNLGCNVRDHVRRICLHTVSRSLRDYLVEELSRHNWLSDEELHLVRYSHLLERLYPYQSFSAVQSQLLPAVEANAMMSGKKRLPLNLCDLALPTCPELLIHLHTPGDLAPLDAGGGQMGVYPAVSLPTQGQQISSGVSSSSSASSALPVSAAIGGYAQVSMDFMQQWSGECRERVLLEQIVSGQNSSVKANVDWSKLVSANSEWRYHLSHLNQTSVLQCIEQWIPTLQDAVAANACAGTATAATSTSTSALGISAVNSPTSPVPPAAAAAAAPVAVLSCTDLWQGLELCPRHVRELVDDELACRGLFSDAELSNFTQLMRRFSRNQLLFSRPHAMQGVEAHVRISNAAPVRAEGDFFPQETKNGVTATPAEQQSSRLSVCVGGSSSSSSSTGDSSTAVSGVAVPAAVTFHRNFVKYCVEHRLANLLYRYLDYHRLARTERSAANVGLSLKPSDNLWLTCLTAFRIAASDPMNSGAVFQASLANARLCLASMVTRKDSSVPISLMLSTNHPLMALGTLMYVPGGLDELLDHLVTPGGDVFSAVGDACQVIPTSGFSSHSNTNSDWPIAVEMLREAVHAYPQLRAALFPVSNANKSPAELQDITLYQLLQGNSPFNPDRLFRWQTTNTLPFPDDDDYLHDMPHFAHTNLVTRYGHVERLSFLHYLRQGQPSLALNTFIAQHHYEGAMGKASIERALNRAMRLALRHFADSKVVSACTVFCELLGHDSLRLRVTVETANRILVYTGQGIPAGLAGSSATAGVSPSSQRRAGGVSATSSLTSISSTMSLPAPNSSSTPTASLTISTSQHAATGGGVASLSSPSQHQHQRQQPSAKLLELLGADAVCKDTVTIAKEFLSLEKHYQSTQSTQSSQSNRSTNSSPSGPACGDAILRYLEAATHILIGQHQYEDVSVEAAYCWHLVMSFCRLYDKPLSTEFLRQCAVHSQWLPFICHAQQHQFEPEQALDVISHHFADGDLREHLRLAFVNMQATPELTRRPRPLPPPVFQAAAKPPPPTTTLFEEDEKDNAEARPRDIRAQFYARVGLQNPTAVAADSSVPEDTPLSIPLAHGGDSIEEDAQTPVASLMASHLSPPKSLADVIALSQRHQSAGSVNAAQEPELIAQHATNIFEVLLACDACEDQCKTLLAHCIAMENPILAVLAACYEGHKVLSCFCAWLCAACGPELLADALPSLADGSIHWREWSHDDLLLLAMAAIDHKPPRTRALSFACQMFDKDNLVSYLLSFHEQFAILNNIPQANLELKKFVELAAKSHPVEGIGGLKLPIGWVQDLSVRTVRSTLCRCSTPSQRRQLVAMLADCGFGRGYSCKVPDFSRLHQLVSILHNAQLNTDLAFAGTALINLPSPPATTTTSATAGDSVSMALPQRLMSSMSSSVTPSSTPSTSVFHRPTTTTGTTAACTTGLFTPCTVSVVDNPAQVGAVEALLNGQFFAEARSYALLVRVGVDLVTRSQVAAFCEDMRRSSLWQSEDRRIGFWHKCSEIFQKHASAPEIPARFFQCEIDKIDAEQVAAGVSPFSTTRQTSTDSTRTITGNEDSLRSSNTTGSSDGGGNDDNDGEFPPSTFTLAAAAEPPSPPVSLKEVAHILCLQLYWQRQCADDDQPAQDQVIQEVNVRALEQKVWMCRIRAELADQASLKRESVSNSLLPSTMSPSAKTLNPVLAPSQALMSWSMDSASLTRILDDLMEDKALEIRHTTPSLVDTSHHAGQLFEGRGWADKLRTDMTYAAWCSALAKAVNVKNTLNSKELSCLEVIQDRLLSTRRFTQACSVACMFGHASPDLELLLTAIRLVRQLTTSSQLADTPEGNVLRNRSRLSSSASTSASSSQALAWRPPLSRTRSQSVMADWLRSHGPAALEITGLLQDLAERSNAGKTCCAQVAVAFQIAKFLDAEYDAVISGSALLILSKLLASPVPCAFVLAQQFVAVSGLSDDEVIGFLGDSVINAIRNAYGLPLPHSLAPALPQRPSTAQFTQVASLCQNHVLLATHLMQAATSAAASAADVSQATLAMEVDLLIHAHTCFTNACDMEGIGTIVRTCRLRVPVLAAAGQFQQMIHMLTGVGRYREMLFVFESLVEHEKLDLLLRREASKEDELKVVLLDFLRKNCPDDSELFSKVAAHYAMWRELAEVFERQGEKELKSLKTHAIDNTMSAPLEGVIRLFVGAAENYMKRNCLRHAQRCMQKARLASLQRRLLPSGTRVINLQPKELRAFMEEHGNFNEAWLVAEAYRSRGLLEWVRPVYVQVIQRGKFRYMQDLTTTLPMATSLVREVAARYRRDTQVPSLGWSPGQRQQYAANMRELLEHVADPRVTYQLAKELGFTDLVTSLLDSHMGQFLQDTGAI